MLTTNAALQQPDENRDERERGRGRGGWWFERGVSMSQRERREEEDGREDPYR